MRKIVVPVVDSPAGRQAIEHAMREAAEGAEVILVATAKVSDHLADNVEAVRDYLARVEKECVEKGIRCSSEWMVGESLGEATLYVAREHEADLIIMGLRRRTPVGKALLGSYEQEILLGAPCPVLSFPAALG